GRATDARGAGGAGPPPGVRPAGAPSVPAGLPADHASGPPGDGAGLLRRPGFGVMGGAAFLIPRYGSGSLSDLVPSALSALGVAGFDNPLGVEPMAGLCILVIDGLGWELLREHRRAAPFLAE